MIRIDREIQCLPYAGFFRQGNGPKNTTSVLKTSNLKILRKLITIRSSAYPSRSLGLFCVKIPHTQKHSTCQSAGIILY